MNEIVWDWRFVIIVFLAIVLFCVFNWQKAKVIAYNGMLRAKSLAKDAVLNSGKEQEDWVVANVYPCLPLPVKAIMSKELFRRFVSWLYAKGKDLLDDGKLNSSI